MTAGIGWPPGTARGLSASWPPGGGPQPVLFASLAVIVLGLTVPLWGPWLARWWRRHHPRPLPPGHPEKPGGGVDETWAGFLASHPDPEGKR